MTGSSVSVVMSPSSVPIDETTRCAASGMPRASASTCSCANVERRVTSTSLSISPVSSRLSNTVVVLTQSRAAPITPTSRLASTSTWLTMLGTIVKTSSTMSPTNSSVTPSDEAQRGTL